MSETIGQRLKQERESRYLTLDKASEDTRIRKIFLQALETDDYSVMPSATQGRGFLRNYAAYLELDIDEMIAEIQKNPPMVEEVSGPLPQVNLVETEIPPLTESEDEEPAPFWKRWLGRDSQAEAAPEAESAEPLHEDADEVNETNAVDESQPVEIDHVELEDEPLPGIWQRLLALIPSRKKEEARAESNLPEEIEEPVVEEAKPQEPLLPADVIFAEIGAQLRERRELISLTYEEVERHIHLRKVFVQALEEGAFDKLPSTVQTRGMLSNYASFLDLDTDAVLLRFADALQARHREKYAEIPREKIQTEVKASIPLLRTFIAGDLFFGVVMIVALIALAIWGVSKVIELQDERTQNTEATAPPIVDVLGADLDITPSPETTLPVSDVGGLTPIPDNNFFTPVVTGTGDVESVGTANVTVSLFAVERVFVRISVDGEVVFEGRMAPRETQVFEAENQVVILTGNAAALRVTYNGRDLGLLGGVGEVVSRVYLENGIVTPTATIPPTPTNTPPTTPTSTPTNTPTATPTVTPPDGG